jgi:HPt (histidine-containing phosphotransfer) domain-containing protein
MLITFLDQFLGTTPVTLRALAQAASVPAREPLRRLAHNLGGTSAYVGAGILHSQAHTLEEAAETEGPGALGARVNELVTEFEAVRPLLVAAREEALQETLAA